MGDGTQRTWVDSMPDAYERWLASAIFHPFAVDVARRVAARAPRRVLELAAGTGVLTSELVAALVGAEITASDLNPAMVRFGRERVPRATWRQADARELPFDDGWFDVVACQFGVMFFPDKRAAFGEARRVLRPDGTLVFNAWDRLETHDFQAAVVGALGQVFPDDPPTFMVAVPHGYSDVDVAVNDVRAAGFEGVTSESLTLEGRAESAAAIATGFCTGTPLRAEIEARGDLQAVTEAVTEAIEARLGSGPITGRMTAYVIEARR